MKEKRQDSPRKVHSLHDLMEMVSGRSPGQFQVQEDSGLAEPVPFPFLALVGQEEMKLALLLALINPALGGVLLIGPRGTGKTTAARSLLDLLPDVQRSTCHYGCLPEDIEQGGIDVVCPDCAQKFASGIPLSSPERARLVELPLNARLDDVVGMLDERAQVHDRLRLKRGILAQADRNILYVDEVNLLGDDIVDAILDAAAYGNYTVKRGAISATYRARFTLIGSMNPEEGSIRPQILDRFGLRVIVRGLENITERYEAYRRAAAHRTNPRQMSGDYAEDTAVARQEILEARSRLNRVSLPEDLAHTTIRHIRSLNIDSLRAELTLFESARAYAAADGREEVLAADIRLLAPLALRLRRSLFMEDYLQRCRTEDNELQAIFDENENRRSHG